MINVAFFGEAMQELSGDNSIRFGGDVYNTAVYFKRLQLKNTKVNFVTALGSDEVSDVARCLWQEQGLSLDYLQIAANKTLGSYGITTDTKGERYFSYERDDSAAKRYFYLDTQHRFVNALREGHMSHCYFSAISLAILDTPSRQLLLDALHTFKTAGGKVIFDSNYRSVLWRSDDAAGYFKKAFQLADYLFVTDDDHYGVFGECTEQQLVAFYQQYSSDLVVIKQGLADTLVLEHGTLQRFPVTPVTQVIDTTSAGDAFSAGFLAAFLHTGLITYAVDIAQQLASQVIVAKGAIVATSIQLEHSEG